MAPRNTVTAEVHQQVLERDGICFVTRVDPTHLCHDQWGKWHPCNDLDKLTVDHVHDEGGMMGRRAPSDAQHLVAMCAQANIAGPSRTIREAERAYLLTV